MIIQKAPKPQSPVRPVELKSLKPGQLFYFATATLEEVLAGEGAGMYIVVDDPSRAKEGRIPIVCIQDGKPLLRDDVHQVHVIEGAKLLVPE